MCLHIGVNNLWRITHVVWISYRFEIAIHAKYANPKSIKRGKRTHATSEILPLRPKLSFLYVSLAWRTMWTNNPISAHMSRMTENKKRIVRNDGLCNHILKESIAKVLLIKKNVQKRHWLEDFSAGQLNAWLIFLHDGEAPSLLNKSGTSPSKLP